MKKQEEKRTCPISMVVTPKEKELLISRAKAEHLPLSVYIRRRAFLGVGISGTQAQEN